MAKTTIDEEIEERVDYFSDWLQKLSDDKESSRVVNERTAIEYIRNTYSKDMSLSNLLQGMDDTGRGMSVLLKSSYIQNLIATNNSGKRLDKGTQQLSKRRKSLETLLPKKDRVTRRAVIRKFSTERVLKNYNIRKDSKGRYRDSRNGRYVSNDRILRVTDLVILKSAAKRKELEVFLANRKK